ncbi:MAG: response regulator [Alphaproteobacteria bacterium]|nr:response regulator [Alphaproteobacteria bacterium]
MPLTDYKESEIAGFVDALAQRAKSPREWGLLHIFPRRTATPNLRELKMYLAHNFGEADACILLTDDEKSLFICAKNDSGKLTGFFDNQMLGAHPMEKIEIVAHTLNEKGIDYIATTLERLAGPDNTFAKMGLIRLRRRSNVFMILDDDPMVLKQLEFMASRLGRVEVFSNAEDFILAYKRFAPNAIIVDIHLRGARGTNVPTLLQTRIDPYVHTIMISADVQEEAIIEAKMKGAKGYISKPVSNEMLMKQVFQAPTFVQRMN